MTTATRTTKAATITRTITISREQEPWGVTVFAQVFEQHHGKRSTKNISDVYILTRIPADFGVGVHVSKQLGEMGEYDVLVATQGGYHECDCPHMTYRPNSKPCRHIEAAIQALREHKI